MQRKSQRCMFSLFLGGDVWVLAIKNAQVSDSGLYICETNTEPVYKSFHNLTGTVSFHFCDR